MFLRKGQLPILVVNLVLLAVFSVIFWQKADYEFFIYMGVIVFFLLLVLQTNKNVNYSNEVLWGLTVWSGLHLSGGGIEIGNGDVLYNWVIWDLVGEPYSIFKFDQFVHIVGFFVATLVAYHVLEPLLAKPVKSWKAVSFVVIMAGLGLGALNEIVEFSATVLVPDTNVGGYENTALDLVADLIGAVIGMVYLFRRGIYKNIKS